MKHIIVNNSSEFDKNSVLKAISAVLETVADFDGKVIRTKQGRLRYFNGTKFIDINVSTHIIKKIASGDSFTLALSRSGMLLLILFSLENYTMHLIDYDVEDIWACGSQFYYKTIKNTLKGVESLNVVHTGATTPEEPTFLDFVLPQIQKVALPVGSKIISLDVGENTAATIVEDLRGVRQLFTWGENRAYQCGHQENVEVEMDRPFNVSNTYKNVPAAAQVVCLKHFTMILTVNKQLWILGRFGNGRNAKQPRQITVDVKDLANLYCSKGGNSVIVTRESYGAIAFGDSPFGNLGLKFHKKPIDYFRDPRYILNECKVCSVQMGERISLAKVDVPKTRIVWRKSFTDLVIVCVEKDKKSDPVITFANDHQYNEWKAQSEEKKLAERSSRTKEDRTTVTRKTSKK
jgi:hypothetical protein